MHCTSMIYPDSLLLLLRLDISALVIVVVDNLTRICTPPPKKNPVYASMHNPPIIRIIDLYLKAAAVVINTILCSSQDPF